MRILFFVLFIGVASAQDLACARLLEALPATRFKELTSFEANFTFQEFDSTITLHQIEDVTNQRSYYESKEGNEISTARYENNTGTIERNGQTEVAPAREDNELLGFFDMFLTQKMFTEAELISCDGLQTLETPEGPLGGEVVTIKLNDNSGQLFLDENGRTAAWRSGSEVGVFDNHYEDNLLVAGALRVYDTSLETPTLERAFAFELVSYDQPVDASLFGETPACEELLETFRTQPEFTSLETTTIYTDDASQPADYKVIDFVGQRVYWEVSFNGIKTIYRFVNGEVTATQNNETIEVPEGIRISLESTFLSSSSFRDLADKAVVLSCDGEQSYSDGTGEIVRGQQITVADKTNPESDSSKLLFDDAGNFIGNYIDRPDDNQDYLLVNSGIKKDEAGVVVEITNMTYLQEGDSFELLSKTTTTTLSYDQPVDETLFAK
jgi:hypothetical protein